MPSLPGEFIDATSFLGLAAARPSFGSCISAWCGFAVFEEVARAAIRGLWERRSSLGLVGAHINIVSGDWTHKVRPPSPTGSVCPGTLQLMPRALSPIPRAPDAA